MVPPPPPFFPYDGHGRGPNFPRCKYCGAGVGPDCLCRFWSASSFHTDAAMRAAARIGTVRYDSYNDEFHLTTPTTATAGADNTGAASGSGGGESGLNGSSSPFPTSDETVKDGHYKTLKRVRSFSEEEEEEDYGTDDYGTDDYDYDEQDDQDEVLTSSEPPAKKLMVAAPTSSLLHPLTPRPLTPSPLTPSPPTPSPLTSWLSPGPSHNQNQDQNAPATGRFWGNDTSAPFNPTSDSNPNSNPNASTFRLPLPVRSLGTPQLPGLYRLSYLSHPLRAAKIGELPPRPVTNHLSSHAYVQQPRPQYQSQPYGHGSNHQTNAPTYTGSSSADLSRLLRAPDPYSYPRAPPPPLPPRAAAPPSQTYFSPLMSSYDMAHTRMNYGVWRSREAEKNFRRYCRREEHDADEEGKEDVEEQEPPPFSPLTDADTDVYDIEVEQPDSEGEEETSKEEEEEEKGKDGEEGQDNLEEMFGESYTCGYEVEAEALIFSRWRDSEAYGDKSSAAACANGSAAKGTRAPSEAGSDVSAASSVTLGRDPDSGWRSSLPGGLLDKFLRWPGPDASNGNGNGNENGNGNDTSHSLGRPSERRILTPRVPGYPRPRMWN